MITSKKFVPPAAPSHADAAIQEIVPAEEFGEPSKHMRVASDDSLESATQAERASERERTEVASKVDVTHTETRKTASERLAEIELKVTRQRKLMNLSKSVAPIVSAIIVNPGSAAKAEEKASAIHRMTSLAMSSAEHLIAEVAPDLAGRGWVGADAVRLCAQIIATEWKSSGSCDSAESLLSSEFFKHIGTAIDGADGIALEWMGVSGNIPPIRNEHEAATRIRLSVMKGFAPLMADIQVFSFWKNKIGDDAVAAFCKDLLQRIADLAAQSANTIADENGISDTDRITLWQSTISRSFEFAREEYRSSVNNVFGLIDKAGIDEKKEIRREYATSNIITDLIVKKTATSLRLLNGVVGHYVANISDADSYMRKEDSGGYASTKRAGMVNK
jgi:hypothetical protein